MFSQISEIEQFIHLNRENEEEYRRERELWIEEMHKTPPDLNWQVIENANHLAKIDGHNTMVNKYLSEGKKTKDMMLETIIGESGLRGEWYEKGSKNQAGRMHTADIDFDNHLIYAGSSGGNIWRGSLTGTDWTCLNNGLQLKGIIYVKVLKVGHKERILIASSSPSGVWFTDDEGIHWTSAKGLEKPHNWGSIRRGVWVNSRNELYILTTEWNYSLKKSITAIYRSTDYGENFKPVMKYNLSAGFCDMWAPEYDYAGVFFVHKDTLSQIEDGKITKLGNINAGQKYSNVSRTFLRGSIINTNISLSMLLVLKNKTASSVYRTHNLKQWYYLGDAPSRTFMGNSFNVSYTDTTLLFVGGMELWRSENNGADWKHVNGWGQYYGDPKNKLHADIPGIIYLHSPQGADLFLIGTDGGLYISKDGLQTVENLSLQGLNVSQYYSNYTYRKSDSIYYLGSQDQGFQRTLNDQEGEPASFVQTISGDYAHLTSSDGGVNLWSVYPAFAMLYENANIPKHKTRTWNFKKELKNWFWLPPIVADPEDPKSAYLVSGTKISSNNGANRIWHITFNGQKMVYDSIDYDFRQGAKNRKPASLAISPLATDFMYVMSNDGKFFMTSDRGKTWEMNDVFKGPGSHYFYGNSVAASASKFGRVYCAGNGYNSPGAYMSDDHGKTWTPIDSGLPKTLIYKIVVTPDDKFIFVASDAGPYVYIMDEGRWYDMSAPETPDQTFWSVEYVSHRQLVRFVTYGRGAWDFKITDFTSNVKLHNEPAVSSQISVYPNPISESGRINLQLNKSVSGSLLLYDLQGKIVKRIYSGEIGEGMSEFIISRYVDGNVKLPAGNYILVLVADGLSNYTKVLLSD
jgi:photosystem II stability/assembly factor-like uncharacterized protein